MMKYWLTSDDAGVTFATMGSNKKPENALAEIPKRFDKSDYRFLQGNLVNSDWKVSIDKSQKDLVVAHEQLVKNEKKAKKDALEKLEKKNKRLRKKAKKLKDKTISYNDRFELMWKWFTEQEYETELDNINDQGGN